MNRFFKNKGAEVIEDETIYEETINGSPEDDDEDAEDTQDGDSDDDYDEEEE